MGDSTTTKVERAAQGRAISNPERPFAVYVAATSVGVEAARVDAAVARLRAHGFAITCTWANAIAKAGEANPRTANEDDRRGWAVQCLNEIDAADAVWVLVPELPTTTRGAWCESGYAYSEKKHLVFSGDTKQSIFCALGYECLTDEQAINHLRIIRDNERIRRGLAELRDAEPIDLRVKNALVGDGGDR